jgi:hypothetical protein
MSAKLTGEVFAPGVYEISNERYHASAGISRSMLMEFKRSPLHFWNKYLNPYRPPNKETAAMKLGTAVHTYLLEQEIFHDQFVIGENFDRRTKEGKQKFAEFELAHKQKTILTQEEMELVKSIAQSIFNHPYAIELINGGLNEKSFFWLDHESGLLCKSRPDIWHDSMLVDLKTANKADAYNFSYSMYDSGYYIQAAMCLDAIKSVAQEEHHNYFFVVAEKDEPFAIATYELSEDNYWQGHFEYKKYLKELKECLDKNEWPGYEHKIISIPRFALTV